MEQVGFFILKLDLHQLGEHFDLSSHARFADANFYWVDGKSSTFFSSLPSIFFLSRQNKRFRMVHASLFTIYLDYRLSRSADDYLTGK